MGKKSFAALFIIALLAFALSIANSVALFIVYKDINAQKTASSVSAQIVQIAQTAQNEQIAAKPVAKDNEPLLDKVGFYMLSDDENEEVKQPETAPIAPTDIQRAALVALIKTTVRNLDKSRYVAIGDQEDFDYELDGGISVMGHYLASLVSYEEALNALLPYKLFVSGPHTDEKPNLEDPNSFGHYNIDAVRYIREAFEEAFSDDKFLKQTVRLYEKHLRSRLNALRDCYNAINANNSIKAQIPKGYKEDWSNINYEIGGCYETYNQTATIPNFWFRRIIDGSDKEFYALFEFVLNAYDPYRDSENYQSEIEIDE
ncbi:MAG: hypothetical protein LBO72_01470 [Helicobacteraceae bacterium]|jgi:hypothetical protein|nr:hypothetical protein [Helicobacteraceae bacterium]